MGGDTPARYPVPAAVHRAEQVIDRSRFVCTLAPAATPERAREVIRSVREEWPDATHHCTAWVAGPPGDTAHVGMSDDGEPHGTAGRPMLNILLHADVGEIVAVVTRWYGGVKLGTGGLARAYSGSVQLALDSLPTVKRIEWTERRLTVDYTHLAPVQRLLPQFEVTVIAEEFGVQVGMHLRLPAECLAEFSRAVADATNGTGEMTEDGGRMTEDGGRMTEDGGRMTED